MENHPRGELHEADTMMRLQEAVIEEQKIEIQQLQTENEMKQSTLAIFKAERDLYKNKAKKLQAENERLRLFVKYIAATTYDAMEGAGLPEFGIYEQFYVGAVKVLKGETK